MSEAIAMEVEDVAPENMSFEERVWRTLSLIDMTEYVSKKTVKVKQKEGRAAYEFTLDYISWVNAWQKLMECFPQSHFEFDELASLPNGTAEQWITLTIREDENAMTRRWWLPVMDDRNQPVANPSSTQINKTRMRVLVKCIAMCGLGIEIYGGEDVQDTNADAEPVTPRRSTSVRQDVIDEMNMTDADWATVGEWAEKLQEAMPTEELIDHDALIPLYKEVAALGEMAIPISHKLTSWQRTALKKVRDMIKEQV